MPKVPHRQGTVGDIGVWLRLPRGKLSMLTVSFDNIAEGKYRTPYTVKQYLTITVSGLSSITTDQITRFQTFEIESNQPK